MKKVFMSAQAKADSVRVADSLAAVAAAAADTTSCCADSTAAEVAE